VADNNDAQWKPEIDYPAYSYSRKFLEFDWPIKFFSFLKY